MSERRNPGVVEISFRYSRYAEPGIHGGVTLKFDSMQPYSFVSRAQWPDSDNYEAAIREAVEQVLLERQGHIKSTRVVLERIEWDSINSCERGFRRAATAATRAAFEV
ncbi:MAG: hypothetical protein ACREFI_00685 [Stellaceae bacterium]